MSGRKLRVVALAVIAAGASVPSLTAQEVDEKIIATDNGVKLTVEADRWTGRPANLTQVIPLLVTLENNGKAPLRMRYDAFALKTPSGQWLPALPPFDIQGSETVQVAERHPFDANGFFISPYLWHRYPYFSRFDGPFYYDPFYYHSFYPAFRRVMLPTGDMVQMVLPEGVLQPGGRITGFLYFESANFDPDRGTFVADLVDAKSLRRLGRIEGVLEID